MPAWWPHGHTWRFSEALVVHSGWPLVTFLAPVLVVCARASYCWGPIMRAQALLASAASPWPMGNSCILALATGRLLSTKSYLLAPVWCVSPPNLLSFVDQPLWSRMSPKARHAIPGVLPLFLALAPKQHWILWSCTLCEDAARCKCLPQLLLGIPNLCECFSWLHSHLQHIWVLKGHSWAGEGTANKIPF